MSSIKLLKYFNIILALCGVFGQFGFVQVTGTPVDSTLTQTRFDSRLLKLNVPETFQRNSLKLEIFSDSSWQMYRGSEALEFTEALEILGFSDMIRQYKAHLEKEAGYVKEFRSRRVFALITALGGSSYLAIIWNKGWIYQIPGYVAISVAGVRLWESRQLEIKALREQYYIRALTNPSDIQQRVDDYNFNLYQTLSRAGIQFSDS